MGREFAGRFRLSFPEMAMNTLQCMEFGRRAGERWGVAQYLVWRIATPQGRLI